MPLPLAEREAFLAEPHIGALAVSRSAPDRAPLTVPIWYWYEQGGELWILTGRDSAKARAIRKAGRFSLMAERLEPTVRYVSVEGPVSSEEPPTEKQQSDLAHRYLPEESARAYLEFARKELGEEVVIRMRPERWLSADMGAF